MRIRLCVATCLATVLLSLCGCQIEWDGPRDADSAASTVQSTSAPIIASTTIARPTESVLPLVTTTNAPPTTVPPVTTTANAPTTTVPPVTTTAMTTTAEPPITEPAPLPVPADADLVLLSEYLPEAILDIRYATTNNFTGQVIYEVAEPRLRYGTVKKLRAVCEKLEEKGFCLVIWDAWRPAEAQWKLWNICPDPTYVSDPTNGYSSHTKGGTVDITLAYADGKLAEMPTDFDDFSKAADLDFSDVSADAAANATLLQQVMSECGFRPYRAEWWHFTDTNAYDVLEALPE